jgi:lipopolysaccharide export system ATP-binding protein
MNSDRLHTENLCKRYKKRYVVNKASIEITQGEIVGLLGPNGAGKTTTFYMITGMIKPNEGRVFYNNTDITTMAMYKRARLGIGYLPQEASVFRKLTVEENIMAILQTLKMSNEERKRKCEKLLTDFGITQIARSKGYNLSGGERRRTEIARSLATDPKFILLDEPFAGIDPLAVEDIMKMIKALQQKNIGILVTDHNVHETLSITDRAYILIDGKIFRSGTADFLSQDEMVKKLYLGESFKLDRYE